MIVVMGSSATEPEIQAVVDHLEHLGLSANVSRGVERTVIGLIGRVDPSMADGLEVLSGVDSVVPITKPYKLASRDFEPLSTVIQVGNVTIGAGDVVMMAGPCTVETERQTLETAEFVASLGANILRGGAYKPSTSPYGFRGLGVEGLKILKKAREITGMPVITEVLTPADVPLVEEYADIFQIGTRNMQNYILLDAVGKASKPAMLKRGMSATIEEWLLAAEYILSGGNKQVILCERGIRTFERATRNTMDISAIPVVKRLSHLPVIADPSQGTGKWYLVEPLALASVAAGADGLIVEVHPNPDLALKDGAQSLSFANYRSLATKIGGLASAVNRRMHPAQVPVAAR
jgi:3-deoxy-7-phosphoheptulonate synthase